MSQTDTFGGQRKKCIVNKTILFLISLLFSTSILVSQNSAHLESFDWMVKTFSENDAGFPYILKKKGETDYSRHTADIRTKIAQSKTEEEYLTLLNDWLYYFRTGHIGVVRRETNELTPQEKDSIIARRKDLERIPMDRNAFERYLKENVGKLNPVEGIWKSRYNPALGIVRCKEDTTHFKVFAIQMTDSVYWQPGQVVADITSLPDGNYNYKSEYFASSILNWMGSSRQILVNSKRADWVKIEPKAACSAKDSLYKEVAAGTKPFVKRLDSKTLYLRIPSLQPECKKAIDQVLAQNDKRIRLTPNLIIDIRNGTGGSDRAWQGLIPYFYTQPIRHPGMRYRAGQMNIDRVEKNGNKVWADQMRANLGGFIDINGDIYTIKGLIPTAFPKKIAIICNQRNASSDESLLFDAKQSFKVKVFGTSTAGMLDFSNINIIDFPDKKYALWLAMSETKGFEKYSIDAAGMHPDFFIPDEVPENDWVDYVRKVLEE